MLRCFQVAKDDVVAFHDFLIVMHHVRESVGPYEMHRLGFEKGTKSLPLKQHKALPYQSFPRK